MKAKLGPFEVLLLQLLEASDDPHGGELRDAVEAATGRVCAPGAVYTALDRLEQRGLVSSLLGEPTPKRGGKRRRHYRIEKAGRLELAEAVGAMRQLVSGVATAKARP
jgi:DNA-binding PadR family transcriptional regulator